MILEVFTNLSESGLVQSSVNIFTPTKTQFQIVLDTHRLVLQWI